MKGAERKYPVADSTTVAANTFGAFSSGYLIPATSSTAELKVLILEDVVSTTGHPEALCVDLDESFTLICDTAGNTSQALVGTKVDLTDATKVNQAATTTKVVRVVATVGAAADKKVLAKVVSKDA